MLSNSHTHLQTAKSPRTDQILQKSVPAQPKKKFIFFFPPFGVFIFFATQKPRHTSILTVQSINKKLVLLDTQDRTPSANSVFILFGLTTDLEVFWFYGSFISGGQIIVPNPQTKQTRNRYAKQQKFGAERLSRLQTVHFFEIFRFGCSP